jgi:hypothetical protein
MGTPELLSSDLIKDIIYFLLQHSTPWRVPLRHEESAEYQLLLTNFRSWKEGHRVANRASIPVSKESLGRVMALDLGLEKDATIDAFWLNDEVS